MNMIQASIIISITECGAVYNVLWALGSYVQGKTNITVDHKNNETKSTGLE